MIAPMFREWVSFRLFRKEQLLYSTAASCLSMGTYFDYLYGRILKVDLSGDEFDERLYERDNGRDSAARAISFLK